MIARNFRTRAGELDVVAAGRGCIVFCEVRARLATSAYRTRQADGPLDSIGPQKRRQLRRMAREWLAVQEGLDRCAEGAGASFRFDAIGVLIDRDGRLLALEHVEDAF